MFLFMGYRQIFKVEKLGYILFRGSEDIPIFNVLKKSKILSFSIFFRNYGWKINKIWKEGSKYMELRILKL